MAIGQDPAHGNGKGLLHCIDAAQTGDITQTGCLWKYDTIQRTMATVAVANGAVYVPDVTGKVHCVDAKTGQRRWVYDTAAETWGGVLVADNKLYVANQRYFFIFSDGAEPTVLCQSRWDNRRTAHRWLPTGASISPHRSTCGRSVSRGVRFARRRAGASWRSRRRIRCSRARRASSGDEWEPFRARSVSSSHWCSWPARCCPSCLICCSAFRMASCCQV